LSLVHHYRGSKMALWLELIPKLHKSDRLDARFHQLDDWDNMTSFDAAWPSLRGRLQGQRDVIRGRRDAAHCSQ